MDKMNQPFHPILIETEMTVSGAARNKYANLGMTMRDYFAAHAPDMSKWFDIKTDDGHEPSELDRFLYWRWFYAEQMMNGREQ